MAGRRQSKTGRKQGWGMLSSPQIQTPSDANRNAPPPGTVADEGEGEREGTGMETAAAEEEEINVGEEGEGASGDRAHWARRAVSEGPHLSSTQHKRNG